MAIILAAKDREHCHHRENSIGHHCSIASFGFLKKTKNPKKQNNNKTQKQNKTKNRKEHPSPVKYSGRQWSTCILTPTKRQALCVDAVGPQLGFLPKKAAEFLFPTHKTGTGQWGTVVPQLPCLLYSDHSFRPNQLFTQSYFQESAFSNILSIEVLGLCKSRDQGDPVTFTASHLTGLSLQRPQLANSSYLTTPMETILPRAKC